MVELRTYQRDLLQQVQTALATDTKARAMQQRPGRIVGMTATPWRLSRKEGFDHLFDELLCGFDLPDAS